MLRRTLVLLVGVPLLVGFAPAPKPKDPKDVAKEELKKLQGTWAVVSLERAGRLRTRLGYEQVVVKGHSWCSYRAGHAEEPLTLALDPKATPKTLDFLWERPPGRRPRVCYWGVYHLDGGTLKVCYVSALSLSSRDRPKAFSTDR